MRNARRRWRRSARLFSHPVALVLGLVSVGALAQLAGSWTGRDRERPAATGAFEEMPVVYGPKRIGTPAGGTAIHVEEFSAAVQPGARYLLRLENGMSDGGARLDSALLVLNGSVRVAPGQFDRSTGILTLPVELLRTNSLEVRAAGAAGSHLTLAVLQEPEASFTVLGPKTYLRETSAPVTVTERFSLPGGGSEPYVLHLRNGMEDGTHRLAAAQVVVNGTTAVRSQDLNGQVGGLTREVQLQAENLVEITLEAKPKGQLTMHINARDAQAPIIEIQEPVAGHTTSEEVVEAKGRVIDHTAVRLEVNGTLAGIAGDRFTATVPLPHEGENTIRFRATDAAGNRTDSTRIIVRDTQVPLLNVSAPLDGSVTRERVATVRGTVHDASSVVVRVDGVPLAVVEGSFAGEITLEDGVQFVTVTATDLAGNSSSQLRQVTLDTEPPVITVSEPAESATVEADHVWVRGTVADLTAVTLTLNGTPVAMSEGEFEHVMGLAVGSNSLLLIATDQASNGSTLLLNVTRSGGSDPTPDLPPDPATVAPALDRTVATTMHAATTFLYTGENPIQTAVAPGTISPVRVSVIRGRVINRQNQPLPGVTISVRGQPLLGETKSRADGAFDLAVNGGGSLTLNYLKDGYLPVQRRLRVPWRDWAHVDDVVMIRLDPVVTHVELANATGIQVARGSVQEDADGPRQATLFFKPGTAAAMVLPDGSRQPLTSLSVRATEYTVGENGPAAMPAPLPATVAYTYAAELSVDQARAAGAKSVEFSSPVPFYLENFPGFPVGLPVPVAWYDFDRTVWVPEDNGRVIQILSSSGAVADIDITGDGAADTESAMAELGIDADERKKLAEIYAPGTSLWRAQTTHFSAIDLNYGGGPQPGSERPSLPVPGANPTPEQKPNCTPGSWIDCENQILRQQLSITGSGHTLHYSSGRVPGWRRMLTVPLIGPQIPTGLLRVELDISVAGRHFRETYLPAENLGYQLDWDELDAFNRPVQGGAPVTIRVGYVYPFVYHIPADRARSFGLSCTGASGEGMVSCAIPGSLNSNARQETTLWQETILDSGPAALETPPQNLGGWSIGVHHSYNPRTGSLHLGTGEWIPDAGHHVRIVAGSGEQGSAGDGGPATRASLSWPTAVAVDADGGFYIADWPTHRIRHVDASGIIRTVAGTGLAGFSGDGGPATLANLNRPRSLAIGPDGSLFIGDNGNNRIRRIDSNGFISTIAGNGSRSFSGDGGPAIAAGLEPYGLAFSPAGDLYIADYANDRVRKITTDGRIYTAAGTGVCGTTGNGGPATSARICDVLGLAAGQDGSIYIASFRRIRRVTPDGIISAFAGDSRECRDTDWATCGDGGPATEAQLTVESIAVDRSGTVYLTNSFNRTIRSVQADGIIRRVVGGGDSDCRSPQECPHGFPARQIALPSLEGIAVGPDDELYVIGRGNRVIYKLDPTQLFPGAAEIYVPAAGGRELYEFGSDGRHLRTLDSRTGAALLSFGYTEGGLLSTITDSDGLRTQVERDGTGAPAAVVAPFGQRTTLSLDTDGYLASVANAAAERIEFGYAAGGLLTSWKDARGGLKEYAYAPDGRLIQASDADGGSKRITSTGSGEDRSVLVATAAGRTTRYRSESLANGTKRRTTVDPSGLETVTLVHTDRSVENISPDGTVAFVTGGPDPRFGMQAPLTRRMRFTTPAGLVLSMSGARGAVLAIAGDPLSVQSEVDSVVVNGRVFTQTYDAAQRRYTGRTAAGRQSLTHVDPVGRQLESSVPGIAAVSYSYDANGFLSTMAQGARSWSYGYDTEGHLSEATDPLSRTSRYFYDAAGRVTRQVLPDRREILYAYDANGNLTSLSPPSRPAHGFAYTAMNLVEYDPPSAGSGLWSTRYSYSLDKELERVTRPDGQTIDFRYDAGGRLSALTTPTGSIGYEYHPTTGHLGTLSAPGGITLGYSYDGSLPTEVSWSGMVSGSVGVSYDDNVWVTEQRVNGGNAIAFQYDDDGLLTRAGALTLSRNAQNGLLTGTSLGSLTQSLGYNAFGEIAGDTTRLGGSVLFGTRYTRDDLGRITSLTERTGSDSTTYEYAYDVIGRLTEVKQDGSPIGVFEWDDNGNRLQTLTPNAFVTGAYDDQDRLLAYGDATYAYTANGELTARLVGSDTTRYEYDVLGNLRSVTLPGGGTIEYLIDGQNRRIGKRVNGVVVQGFLYGDQLNPAAELDGNGNVVSRFVYGSKPHVPDYVVRYDTTYRIVSDHLGSVRLVVNAGTGEVVQRITYDVWGWITSDSNPGLQPFGFAGGLYEQSTGLTRFGARDYDPHAGRWTSKDPIRFAGGTSNLYAYALADPINLIDTSGRVPWPLVLGGIALWEGYQHWDDINKVFDRWKQRFDENNQRFIDTPVDDQNMEQISDLYRERGNLVIRMCGELASQAFDTWKFSLRQAVRVNRRMNGPLPPTPPAPQPGWSPANRGGGSR
jgi:RHS repeat-associated protein